MPRFLVNTMVEADRTYVIYADNLSQVFKAIEDNTLLNITDYEQTGIRLIDAAVLDEE